MKDLLNSILLENGIPKDIIESEITPYFSLSDYFKTRFLNKNFNSICQKYKRSVCKIQKSFRYHRLPENGYYSLQRYMPYDKYLRFLRLHKLNLYYRFYMVKYPEEYLFNLPEFMLDKLRIKYNTTELQEKRRWVEENLPMVKNRKRRDILNFLKSNRFKVKDFVYVGM